MLFFQDLVSALLWLISSTNHDPQLQLGGARLRGRHLPDLEQEFFGGIPFAEPPVGDLRLAPPVLKLHLDVETFDARAFGSACIQEFDIDDISEDCLTIDVRRPSHLPRDLLPVMVWIYGGGFAVGDASSQDGSALIAESVSRGTPIIYVSFNYRLGPLGFPQGSEAATRGILNLGLKDQHAALQWVQHNIAAFGGDKSKVTVFGGSAGAVSIAVHMLRPEFGTLARAAILQSGSAASTRTVFASAREDAWASFVRAVSPCASTAGTDTAVDCMRNASLDARLLVRAYQTVYAHKDELLPFVPTLDSPDGLYPALPSAVLASGAFALVPFIAGTVLDEGTMFTPADQIHGPEFVRDWLQADFSPPFAGQDRLDAAVDELMALYPDVPACGSPYGSGNETFGIDSNYKRLASLLGDYMFDSQRRLLLQRSAASGVRSYGYLLAQPPDKPPTRAGVAHGSDIPLVFFPCWSLEESQRRTCEMMKSYWLSFATGLDPNDDKGAQRPAWSAYSTDNEVIMELTGESTTLIPDVYRKAQIDFMNDNAPVLHH